MTEPILASQWLLDTTRAFLTQEDARGLYTSPVIGALPGGYDLYLGPPNEETDLILGGLLRLNDRDLITTDSQPGLREILPKRWLRPERKYVQHEYVEMYVYDPDLAAALLSDAKRHGYESVVGARSSRFTQYSRPVSYVVGGKVNTRAPLEGEAVFDPTDQYGFNRTSTDLDRADTMIHFVDPEPGRRQMIDVLASIAEEYRENER